MQGANQQVFFLFITAAMVVFALAFYGVFKMLYRLRKPPGEQNPTQVGFVVDTFHDLVAELKEKESELDGMRKRAEERADIMEDYNENILQSVPSGVVSMDASWKVVKANGPACHMLGLDQSDLKGRDGREVFGDILKKAVKPDGSLSWPRRGELAYPSPSGRRLWLGYTLSPLKDALGTEIGRLLVFTDLTELKALAEQADLRKRLSSLGEMAAGIAHEIRNPLAVISGYARMLKKKMEPGPADTVVAIEAEVAVMDRIISDFLSFARPRELQLLDINLRSLISSSVEKVRQSSDNQTPDIKIEIDSGISLRGDEVMLRQAITNLLMNAMEATPVGGSITFSSSLRGEDVVLSVSDTGHGIDKSVADRIFNPFFTTKEKGTGLGLALVHRIITSHGGSITLKSSDEGTVFTIVMPRKGPEGLEGGQLALGIS